MFHRKHISEKQRQVMNALYHVGMLRHPRGSLERLHKKGLVDGNRVNGWKLTTAGRDFVRWSFEGVGRG